MTLSTALPFSSGFEEAFATRWRRYPSFHHIVVLAFDTGSCEMDEGLERDRRAAGESINGREGHASQAS